LHPNKHGNHQTPLCRQAEAVPDLGWFFLEFPCVFRQFPCVFRQQLSHRCQFHGHRQVPAL